MKKLLMALCALGMMVNVDATELNAVASSSITPPPNCCILNLEAGTIAVSMNPVTQQLDSAIIQGPILNTGQCPTSCTGGCEWTAALKNLTTGAVTDITRASTCTTPGGGTGGSGSDILTSSNSGTVVEIESGRIWDLVDNGSNSGDGN